MFRTSRLECNVLEPGIFHFFGDIGTSIGTNWYQEKVSESLSVKIWYRKKVSEPVSEKFGTGKSLRTSIKNKTLIFVSKIQIYDGYRYRIGIGTENFSDFWWYRNRYRKKLVPEKSLGTGIGKNWYRKKLSEPVFGVGKKYWYRYRLTFLVL